MRSVSQNTTAEEGLTSAPPSREGGPKAQSPALSPNGDTVLYTQKINGEFQILKLDISSGVQTQLTHIDWNFGGDWFDPAYALPVSPQPQLLTTTWGELKQE